MGILSPTASDFANTSAFKSPTFAQFPNRISPQNNTIAYGNISSLSSSFAAPPNSASFSTDTQQLSSSPMSSGGGAGLPRDQLEFGSRIVDKCQESDRNANDLSYRLKLQRLDVGPTYSGLSDVDYSSVDGVGGAAEFTAIRRTPLPQELLDQFNSMQCHCTMGLFPSMERAWLAVDSDLFIWNFESGADLAYFDGVQTVIVGVALVRPRAGLFQPHIHHLLCVATALEIVLLAVNFSDHTGSPVAIARVGMDFGAAEMHLLPDPLFTVPLDGVVVSFLTSTESGRIFLAARDGCLYEIDYQDKGWFRRQCKKINRSKGMMSYLVPSFVTFAFGADEPLSQVVVDESRHILFTRSEKGSLQVFDLGADGGEISKTASLSSDSIGHSASRVCPNIDPSHFRRIIDIIPIRSAQSTVINLIGLTDCGVRLYFSCYYPPSTPFYQSAEAASVNYHDLRSVSQHKQTELRPLTLRLVHVRLAPGYSATTGTVAKPRRVHLGSCDKDACTFVSANDEESDTLWCLGGALFPFHQDLVETFMQLPVQGRAWTVSQYSKGGGLGRYERLFTTQQPESALPVQPPSLVTQHAEGDNAIAVMTAQGIHTFEKRRPLDVLRCLLAEFGPEAGQTFAFLQALQADEACALLAMLASTTSEPSVGDSAVRALFLFGGEPTMGGGGVAEELRQHRLPTSPTSGLLGQTPRMAPASPMYASTPYMADQQAMANQRMTSPLLHQQPMSESPPEIVFSNRHNGLYLCFGRIVGPLWQMRMVTNVNATTVLDSSFTMEELSWFRSEAEQFRQFLDEHGMVPSPVNAQNVRAGSNIPQRLMGYMRQQDTIDPSHTNRNQVIRRRNQIEAANAERQSLLRLYELTVTTCEVLGLWKVLSEHQFLPVVSQLPNDIKQRLTEMSFKHIVVYGKEVCADLITCLIRFHLGDDARTDAISARLRSICPTLYSTDDASVAKASELLHAARSAEGDEKTELLREALTLYKRTANQLHLPSLCLQFQDVHFFEGIVDLCLRASECVDPNNLSVAFVQQPISDEQPMPALRQIYQQRTAIYRNVTDALDRLLTPGAAIKDDRLSPRMAELAGEQMLRSALQSRDELCHAAVFDWMVERGHADRLLQADSAYLESYLQRRLSELTSGDSSNQSRYQQQSAGDASSLTSQQQYLDLLWRLYEKTQRYLQAAKLLSGIAERHNVQLSLSRRVSYLSRALVCAKAISADDGDVSRKEFVQELEDKLEVARLQSQLLDSLKRNRIRDQGDLQVVIRQLNSELYDVTQLYAEFAERYDLPESKLAILHCAGHYDQQLVENLWENTLENELSECQQESMETRSKRLETKMKQMVKQYSSATRYFPIDFLLPYLQRVSFSNDFPPTWLPSLCKKLDVISQSKLLTSLNAQYGEAGGAQLWKSNRRARVHLLTTVIELINTFLRDAPRMDLTDRRRMATLCLDAIAFYSIDLQTAPHGAQDLSQLRQHFQELQLRIERLT